MWLPWELYLGWWESNLTYRAYETQPHTNATPIFSSSVTRFELVPMGLSHFTTGISGDQSLHPRVTRSLQTT